MTIENKDRENLIKHRLKQADETISDVELLIANIEFEKEIVIEMFLEMQEFISVIKSHLKID